MTEHSRFHIIRQETITELQKYLSLVRDIFAIEYFAFQREKKKWKNRHENTYKIRLRRLTPHSNGYIYFDKSMHETASICSIE